jgi:hypothetical protein
MSVHQFVCPSICDMISANKQSDLHEIFGIQFLTGGCRASLSFVKIALKIHTLLKGVRKYIAYF